MFLEPWRMWLKTQARVPSTSLPGPLGIKMLGAEEEKESNVSLRKKRESLIAM